MPGPTEEEILTQILESGDESSKTNRNIKIQKWLCLVFALGAFAAVFFGYKYSCIPVEYLLFLSTLSGMGLIGFLITHQAQYKLKLLRPYLNLPAIQERLNAIRT